MSHSRSGSLHAARQSRNLSHLRQVQLNGVRNSDTVLAALRTASHVPSKSFLPAELLAAILDYLPVPDLMRFARTSRRMQEMVYDDTRWVQKLKMMGIWNEGEARQRVEDVLKKKAEAQRASDAEAARRARGDLAGGSGGFPVPGRKHSGSTTLFDASVEEHKARQSLENAPSQTPKRRSTLADGFDDLTLAPSSNSGTTRRWDPNSALTTLSKVRSIRGFARQEFGKVYGALDPLYSDLSRSRGHADALIFRTYREPEHQAQALSSLKCFARCDTATGWEQRLQRLESITGVFENAVLQEFEHGIAANEVAGRMRRYAHVLVTLGTSSACVDTYISSLPVMARGMRLGNPSDCLEGVAHGHVDLNPSARFFENLARIVIEQADAIDRIFPPSVDVLSPLLSRICEDIISEYLTALFDDAHVHGPETYVKAVAGTFEQALRFVAALKPAKASPKDFEAQARQMATSCFERHTDLYLTEELALFRSKADAALQQWDQALSEQEASTESFFMSNINRQAAKRDFLSSFKKVVMMPVNVLPAMASPFGAARPATSGKTTPNLDSVDTAYVGARHRSLTTFATSNSGSPLRPGTPSTLGEAPKDELAAKAAIMNSRLEGIKGLFSLEVALDLTHTAKASIERAAAMVQVGGRNGQNARVQCSSIFVSLVDHLGDRHVRVGFDKAVTHLGDYNPRQVREFRLQAIRDGSVTATQAVGVEPLVTFLELVNVGDLIQQMIDVFYSQELVATRLVDRDDFLDPAVKEKKRFEQMLDERVAAGLSKGIDVLMDEVDFLCATTQSATDFNPEASGSGGATIVDIGPSATAKQIVEMVGSHTGMLVGSTDKNMLDVFTQEVGLRLFGVLSKHFKRQRISVDGAIKLISDINHYSAFVASLRQKPLQPYFHALRELAQIYLVHIDPPTNLFTTNATGKRGSLLSSKGSRTAAQAKELATIIADTQRYHGILGAEEVYEFAQRRADWYLVKGDVEKAMYGVGCALM